MAKVSDLTIRDNSYWDKRFVNHANTMYNFGDDIIPEVQKLYNGTRVAINDRVNAFYGKYGVMKSSPTFKTLADGTKIVTGTSNKLVVTTKDAFKPLSKGTRMSKLQGEIYSDLVSMSKVQNDLMKGQFSALAKETYYDMYYEIYRGYGVGTSFNVLPRTVINQLITNPVNGQAFSTRVWNNRDLLANQVNQILTNGIQQGLSNGQMTKQLSDRMGKSTNVAKRLIRTEVTNTYNQAQLTGWNDTGLVQRYEFIATLDSKTSDVCTALDGEIFKVSEAVTGVNMPPIHVNCRSTTAAYFDNSGQELTRTARQLGGNTFTVPASMDASNFKSIYVDKTLTRKQWDAGKRASNTNSQRLKAEARKEIARRGL